MGWMDIGNGVWELENENELYKNTFCSNNSCTKSEVSKPSMLVPSSHSTHNNHKCTRHDSHSSHKSPHNHKQGAELRKITFPSPWGGNLGLEKFVIPIMKFLTHCLSLVQVLTFLD